MPDFSKLFAESQAQPIDYNGRRLILEDVFPLSNGTKNITVVFRSTNSNWKQGICLELDAGKFLLDGRDLGECIVLWEDTAPDENVFELTGIPRKLYVPNVWDTGNGAMMYCYYGAAMFTENIDHGKRYYCNDGNPDEDFDDIIFTITTS